ncbi:hypothetical protein [Nonomuraea sp. GTA35]|uniref:hypothetical protein n=1 Tax=Nonomuraea sp. GTA35 TaxID=1676746 RepID=UPI0035BF5A11
MASLAQYGDRVSERATNEAGAPAVGEPRAGQPAEPGSSFLSFQEWRQAAAREGEEALPDEDRDERDADIIGPHGARVLEDQSTTCIYHPGNRMRLWPGRLKQLTEDMLRDGTWIVCHDTIPPYPHGATASGAAMCRAFLNRYGERSEGVRFLRDVFGLDEVARPEDGSNAGQRVHRIHAPSSCGHPSADEENE